MRRAWSIIEATWAETVLRARRLDEVLLHQRVNDEWSFVETLRHLIFAHDRWVRRTILGDTAPFHRLGLPPDNKVGVRPDAAVDVSALGVDVLAEATVDDVLTVREERTREVRTIVSGFVKRRPEPRLRPESCAWRVAAVEAGLGPSGLGRAHPRRVATS